GADAARAIFAVSLEGLALIRSLIRRFAIDCDFVDGSLLTAVKARHVRELEDELADLNGRHGYKSLRYVPREELRTLLASERYLGALYDANAGHLHPLNYTLGLAAAAASLGVQIFEGSRALSFGEAAGARVRVATAQGEVRARQLVLCGNVYLDGL